MLKPWIENISYGNLAKGLHHDAGPNSMLIQIVDHELDFPIPLYPFKEIHQYKFVDVENQDEFDIYGEGISDIQAQQILNNLTHALDNHMNVIVHCVAGLCRSGAVAEIGIIMGFREVHHIRQPNLLVKSKLMRLLGMTYD